MSTEHVTVQDVESVYHLAYVARRCLRLDEGIIDVDIRLHALLMHLVKLQCKVYPVSSCQDAVSCDDTRQFGSHRKSALLALQVHAFRVDLECYELTSLKAMSGRLARA